MNRKERGDQDMGGSGPERLIDKVRETFVSGKTKSFEWRQAQLWALLSLLREREDEIFKALKEDLGKHRVESYKDEVGVLIKSANTALKGLKSWMAPERVSLPLVAFPARAELIQEPFGVVLVFSSWNFPIGLALEPLIGAISAGNCVVLKPSEHAPATAAFLANKIPEYLDQDAVMVIQGGPLVGEQLLEYKWDKIFFTGSPRIGRIVMGAAAKHLTPVALELGGKCPAIFDSLKSTVERKIAVDRLVGGKWGLCAGQACIGIDYLLVEEKFASTLIELIKAAIKRFYSKPEHITRIVNKQHFQRLTRLLQDPSVAASIVHGGSSDSEKLYIEPTILLDPPVDAEIMQEEIFGPLLPIITLKKIEDSVEFIRARPKPLVIYAFTHNEALKKRIVEDTSSGSITFNDAIIQFAMDSLPFGGVGQSGMGEYHGKFSFDTFSHKKPVMRRNYLFDFSFRYPPWSEKKLRLIRHTYSFDYVSLVLCFLGLKK